MFNVFFEHALNHSDEVDTTGSRLLLASSISPLCSRLLSMKSSPFLAQADQCSGLQDESMAVLVTLHEDLLRRERTTGWAQWGAERRRSFED